MEKYYLASTGILLIALLFILFTGLNAKTGNYVKLGAQYFTKQPLTDSMKKSVEYNYKYGANQGPQGQQYIRSTDKWFNPYEPKQPEPYLQVCCNVVKMAEHGQIRCPETREQAVQSCSIDGFDGSYTFPPCPPNNLKCFLPFEDGKTTYEDEELLE